MHGDDLAVRLDGGDLRRWVGVAGGRVGLPVGLVARRRRLHAHRDE